MMTETLLFAAGTIFVGGLIAELFVIATAPVGYQDENGFHLGTQLPPKPLLTDCGEARSRKPVRSFRRRTSVNLLIPTRKTKHGSSPFRRCRETIG